MISKKNSIPKKYIHYNFKKLNKKRTTKKIYNFNKFKKKLILNNFDFNSLNNFKKLFFFINRLKKRKAKILLIGNSEMYNIINSLFYIKGEKKKLFKFKKIVFYKDKWVPGSITLKKDFFRNIKKHGIKLIIILNYNQLMFNQINEIIKLKLPLVFFSNYNNFFYYKSKIVYNIIYYKNVINYFNRPILLIYLLKFVFF